MQSSSEESVGQYIKTCLITALVGVGLFLATGCFAYLYMELKSGGNSNAAGQNASEQAAPIAVSSKFVQRDKEGNRLYQVRVTNNTSHGISFVRMYTVDLNGKRWLECATIDNLLPNRTWQFNDLFQYGEYEFDCGSLGSIRYTTQD